MAPERDEKGRWLPGHHNPEKHPQRDMNRRLQIAALINSEEAPMRSAEYDYARESGFRSDERSNCEIAIDGGYRF